MPLTVDYLKASDGLGDAAQMHVTNSRSIGATTIEVDSVANVPNEFIGTYGELLPSGFIDPSTAVNFYGHLAGADLEIDGFLPGSTDDGNTTADYVVIRPNSFWANLIGGFIGNVSAPDGSALKNDSVDTAQIVDGAVETDKIADGAVEAAKMGAEVTATLGITAWNDAKISGYTTNFRMGSSTSGVAQTVMAVNIASLGIPDNAVVLEYHFYYSPAGNSGSLGAAPALVYSITRSTGVHSISLTGQWACNDATAPNLTNSKVQGIVRYIA